MKKRKVKRKEGGKGGISNILRGGGDAVSIGKKRLHC